MKPNELDDRRERDRALAYWTAGCVSVIFLKKMPGLAVPFSEIADAVERVLGEMGVQSQE